MSFFLFFLAGSLSGLFGGMGMGGGTVLIPALTIFMGVEQHIAQAANLIAFLPMSLFSLKVHRDNGLLRTQGLWKIVLPAVLLSVGFGFLAAYLPADILRKLFGAFLTGLALYPLSVSARRAV